MILTQLLASAVVGACVLVAGAALVAESKVGRKNPKLVIALDHVMATGIVAGIICIPLLSLALIWGL